METQTAEQPKVAPAPRQLTAEERNDLRRRVLSGTPLTIEEARDVIASVRQGQGVAALAGEAKATRKGKGGAKKALSDDQLDADLATLGL